MVSGSFIVAEMVRMSLCGSTAMLAMSSSADMFRPRSAMVLRATERNLATLENSSWMATICCSVEVASRVGENRGTSWGSTSSACKRTDAVRPAG